LKAKKAGVSKKEALPAVALQNYSKASGGNTSGLKTLAAGGNGP
jgi:hypothetical protein